MIRLLFNVNSGFSIEVESADVQRPNNIVSIQYCIFMQTTIINPVFLPPRHTADGAKNDVGIPAAPSACGLCSPEACISMCIAPAAASLAPHAKKRPGGPGGEAERAPARPT